MNDREYRAIRASESAARFALQLVDPAPRVTQAAERLQAAVAEVKVAELQQLLAKNLRRAPQISRTRAKMILLRKSLGPIAADGREMLAGLPGIEETLRLPRIKDPPAKHLDAAKRIRRVAEEHEQEFIDDRKYPADFLAQFDLAVQNLESAARVERGAARMTYTRATQNVQNAITRLRRALNVLDTRIRESYLDDEVVLKSWQRGRRIPGKIGRPKKRRSSAPRVREHGVEGNPGAA